MRTKFFGVIFVILVVTTIPAVSAQTQTSGKSSEIVEAEKRLKALEEKVEEAKKRGGNSEEMLVLLRAQAIELERLVKLVKDELKERDTPAMKKARKEIRKETDHSKDAEEEMARVKTRSGLTCRTKDEFDKVLILSSATERGLGFVHSIMTVVHKGNIPVDIRQTDGGGGVVVKNMCPGGSLSLSKRLRFGDGYQTISYNAIGLNSVGQAVTSYSPQIQLSSCQGYGCRYEFAAVWEIRLQ